MPTPTPGADSLIAYLNLHSPILTDQGINVQAFIDRLSAYKNRPPNARTRGGAKVKARKTRRESPPAT